jgi:Signal recognition particle GTPase
MFGQITEKFQSIIKNVRGLGKITDKNIHDTVREVRRTLIDADVNFKVVKSFVSVVEQKAQGTKILKSIKPGQQFVKIIKDELVKLLGSESKSLILNKKPSVILLSGLQGAGKTTTAGKLAFTLMKEGKSVLLVAADIYRPAAVEQLKIIGRKIKAEVFEDKNLSPELLCSKALEKAKLLEKDVVIIDTAGRLHIDKEMMKEVKEIAEKTSPEEILFIADGMSGQDAISSTLAFHKALSLSGVVLTKMDGDSRGGAAVSISHITGVPIKYIGNSRVKLMGLKF